MPTLLIFFFISTSFPAFFLKELGSPNSGFLNLSSSMASKKTIPEKKRTSSSSRAPPPSPDNPKKFITREAEKLYHESPFNMTFIAECGLDYNLYFTFMIQDRGWTTLCTHPQLGIAPVFRKFHPNLRFRLGTAVYVRGKWVDFSAIAINRVYNLVDNYNDAYRASFQDTENQSIMRSLTRGKGYGNDTLPLLR